MCTDLRLGPRAQLLTGHTPRHPFPRPRLTSAPPGSHCSVSPTRHIPVHPRAGLGGTLTCHPQAVPRAQQLSFHVMLRYPHVHLPSLARTVARASVSGLLLCGIQVLSRLPCQRLFLRPSALVIPSPDCASSQSPQPVMAPPAAQSPSAHHPLLSLMGFGSLRTGTPLGARRTQEVIS